MNRKILLVEPDYKNKYPPIGLMKLSTYFKMMGDEVSFFKGNMLDFAADLITWDLIDTLSVLATGIKWKKYYPDLLSFIRKGQYASLPKEEAFEDESIKECIKEYRLKYTRKEYFAKPRFDFVGITTLFTFYWDITIDTINFAKQLCKSIDSVMIGGVMSSILPDKVYEATGIHPFVGQLSHPGDIDDNDIIIDHLPLDYSILDETDYEYPVQDAYFSYMTRGCINRCKFCAVPRLEPEYCDYIGLKENIDATIQRFGAKRDLLLLDNNVLASECFPQIVQEIENCGFRKDAKVLKCNEYDIIYKNLLDSYNDKAYIKKMIMLYKTLVAKIKDEQEKQKLYESIEEADCLYPYTATKEKIIELHPLVKPLYDSNFNPGKGVTRYVDFNQGIDSRLVTPENMALLSRVNIRPLRIAFDHWELRDVYEKSVRISVQAGITHLSNYLLYNFEDKPEHLYYRLRINVDLCEELDANIYSFPMKYHPIMDEKYFMNRDYIGKHWNRKFIRAVQAVLNSTKGKIGRGVDFFEEAFGKDVDEFMKILWMPETFIIYRRIFDASLREKLKDKYVHESVMDCDWTNDWWRDFSALSEEQSHQAKNIIAKNDFEDIEHKTTDLAILKVLRYYQITRDDVSV